MSLHFLVDGYNVINQVSSLKHIPVLENARLGLARLIKSKCLVGSKNNRITLVFDGRDDVGLYSSQAQDSVEIIFSKGESADEVIKRFVQYSANPKQIVVVSDDKEILRFIRPLGAKALPVAEFMFKESKQARSRQKNKQDRSSHSPKQGLTYQQQEAIRRELMGFWQE